jgi:hypothetical protein
MMAIGSEDISSYREYLELCWGVRCEQCGSTRRDAERNRTMVCCEDDDAETTH